MFDFVSAHIPLKIKEKVWAGEYIDMSLMLKSGKDLVYDSQLNGELAVKGCSTITENCKKVNYDLLQAESGWFP
jgi:hypothetical protein